MRAPTPPPGAVDAALVNLCRVKKGFEEQYLVACDAEAAMEAAPRAARDAAERAANVHSRGFRGSRRDGQPVETTEATEASSGFADAPTGALRTALAEARAYDTPRGAIARWCMGLGVDAAALHAEFGLGFDFHGPAGAVSRAIVAAAAARAGDAAATSDDADSLLGQGRVGGGHGALRRDHSVDARAASALGRSWKVCWVADAARAGGAAVFLWVPERNAYYTPSRSPRRRARQRRARGRRASGG